MLLALLLIPNMALADTVKLIENTDMCLYKAELDKDYCYSIYEICDDHDFDVVDLDFDFKARSNITTKDLITYQIKENDILKPKCKNIKIEAYKNPFIDVDNIPIYKGIHYKEFAWWDSSYRYKYPLNCTISNGSVNIAYLINDSYVIINDSKEIIWGNYTCNTTSQIVGYLYFTNWTHYALTDLSEINRVSMNVDEGNETDYGNFDPHLVGWWHMKDTGNLIDETNYSNNCTKNGNPIRTEGVIGHDILFDGSGDYYNCGDDDDFDFGTDISFTISVWANMSNALPQMGFINKRNSATGDGWFILYQPATPDILEFGLRGTNGQNAGCTAFAHQDSTYHHYTFVADRSADTASCYIDSVLNDSADISLVGSIEEDVAFLIGDQVGAVSEYNGSMDEIKVYRKALTPNEILAEYENQIGTNNIIILGNKINAPPLPPPVNVTNITYFVNMIYCENNYTLYEQGKDYHCNDTACFPYNWTKHINCPYGCEDNLTKLGAGCIPTTFETFYTGWGLFLIILVALLFGSFLLKKKKRKGKRWI